MKIAHMFQRSIIHSSFIASHFFSPTQYRGRVADDLWAIPKGNVPVRHNPLNPPDGSVGSMAPREMFGGACGSYGPERFYCAAGSHTAMANWQVLPVFRSALKTTVNVLQHGINSLRKLRCVKRSPILLTLMLLVPTAGNLAAGHLVGITANSLVVINPTNLTKVAVIGTFTLPSPIQVFGALTFHRGSSRLYALGTASNSTGVTNEYLLAFEPATGNATVAASLEASWSTTGGAVAMGYEALEYVDSIGSLVATRFMGNFAASTHVRMSENGTTSPLVSNSRDNDFSVYDLRRNIYYTADANEIGQIATVDLTTASTTPIGLFSYGEMAYSPDDDRIYVLGNPDAAVLRQIRTSDGGAPITTSLLGSIPGQRVLGIAYVDAPATHLTIRTAQVELCWPTASNVCYQVMYRSELTTNEWQNLGEPIVGNGQINCVTDMVHPGSAQRFYKVEPTDCGVSPSRCPSAQTNGGIVGSRGIEVRPAAPASVDLQSLVSNTTAFLLPERIGHVTAQSVAYNIRQPGSYEALTSLGSYVLPAGTRINSYLLHFDTQSTLESDPNFVVEGSVTFDAEILGVIVLPHQLSASDSELASQSTAYPPFSATWRGLELNDQGDKDSVTLSADRRTIKFSMRVREWMDQVRVITSGWKACL